MICSTSITSSVQPQEILFCKGTNMKTNLQIESQGLLPAECQALAASMGSLLTALGNLLQDHPDLHAELSPNASQILITIGDKLNRVGKAASV
jgi:hypothetical protein